MPLDAVSALSDEEGDAKGSQPSGPPPAKIARTLQGAAACAGDKVVARASVARVVSRSCRCRQMGMRNCFAQFKPCIDEVTRCRLQLGGLHKLDQDEKAGSFRQQFKAHCRCFHSLAAPSR